MKKIVILILSSFLLSGCGHLQKKPTTVYRCKSELNLPDPKPVELQDIEWITIARDKDKTTVVYKNRKVTMEKFWQLMEDSNKPTALFALTGQGYEDLSINMQKIQEWSILKTLQHERTVKYYQCEQDDK